MNRRQLGGLAAALALAPTVRAAAQGRDSAWPNRPIRIIVGFGAGGVADTMARLMAPKLAEALGQPVVVDNRPGANAVIAAEATAQAAPDGHTIMLSAETLAVSPFLVPNLPYRPLSDFAFVTQCGYFDHVVMVGRNSRFQTLDEVIAAARARPDHVTVGAIGTLRVDKLRVQGPLPVEPVAFRTTPDLLAAIANGTVDAGIDVIGPTLSLIQSGLLRALATTGRQQSSILPQVRPAVAFGLGYVHTSWNGIIGPRALPQPIIERLNREFHVILQQPDIVERFTGMGVTARYGSPQAFADLMRGEVEVWKGILPLLSPA
jgi:tripartite-type tricarboxylate transporter receptor subunit TctC